MVGTGSQTGAASRWGDYSSMSVDPVDDCTFYYTQEYIQTTGSATWRTRIGKFTIPTCGPPPAQPPPPPPPPPPGPPPPPPPPHGRLHDHDRNRQRSSQASTDLGIHCDDCYRPVTFPFPVRVYNTTYNERT